MYALSRQQEELADVVYAFSALLRNNTTQEKIKTLAEEVTFCEKYVYLYQMRYPDKIAYHGPFRLSEMISKPKLLTSFLVIERNDISEHTPSFSDKNGKTFARGQ